MKRKFSIAGSIFLLLTAFISAYLTANSRKNSGMAKISKVHVTNILHLPNKAARYNAYLTLDEKEKCLLWETRLEEYMEKYTLSESQVNTINKAIEILEPTMFVIENGSLPAAAHFKAEDMKQQFIAAFGYDIARQLLADITEMKTREGFVVADCPCSVNSDWCSSGNSCWPDLCQHTSSGCGTLWLYSCNGSCNRNTGPGPDPDPQ